MSFGLTNALEAFMNLMTNMFQPYLDSFVIVFINDILVYSRSREEHEQYLSIVLQILMEKKLYAKFSKCVFWFDLMEFLGNLVFNDGIKVDLKKMQAAYSLAQTFYSGRDQEFLGFSRLLSSLYGGILIYCNTIDQFDSELTVFTWSNKCEEIFQKLKNL